MTDLLLAVGAIAACCGMYYLSTRIEPHWIRGDGRRMILAAQPFDGRGNSLGRKFEARVEVQPDGSLVVGKRRLLITRRSAWWVHAKSPDPPPRRVVYALRPADGSIDSGTLVITLPAKSRAIAIFDELLERQKTRPAG